ncbi:transmembrane 9 superfamily member 1-like [Eriocheir sinensis]|uniref:transmembrane 9 superfamily member 1-like n=1 Tax=Eriocheir sinensis TaxID=95602 RepID=UPI0021C6BAFA|nr:transmembrane 9 superfamily member 1-like [Eriocheir sinensis]
MKRPLPLFAFAAALRCVLAASYQPGGEVVLYVNKVGPYFNPHETYHYYQLPVCRPTIIEHKSLSLGEVLDGDRMAKSNYVIKFKENIEDRKLCDLRLSEEEVQYLREAIEENYYYEFVIDDISVRDFVGHLEESGFVPHTHKVFLWTHQHFNILYNEDKIIYVNTTKEHGPVSLDDVEPPLTIKITYSVTWTPTQISYSNRGRVIQDNNFFPRSLEIHWLSIINSMVLVFLLMGFVVIILTRVLRNDFARYNISEEGREDVDSDEYGWKIIHTDVFRFPKQKSLFSAILGVGCQFLAVAVGIIGMALMGMFNVHRHGSMNSAAIFLYALASTIAGYVSASHYRMMGGQAWISNVNLTTVLFAGPFFLIWSVQNSVAWAYNSTQALPFTTIVLLFAVWLCVGYPLTVFGGILGKNSRTEFNFPCRTKNIAREIPAVPWYRSHWAHFAVGGFLPFSAISVEMYYIFSTLWGREHYTLYGILGVVFVILLSVTACVSVALTYFQLSAEDYRWWWRSIFSAGSTGGFVLLYCIFYYLKRSNMSGGLQTIEFVGWSILTCYVFFLTLGTVSFLASLCFVKYIYRNIKMD